MPRWALVLAVFAVDQADALAHEHVLYRVLQFHGRGDIVIDDATEDVREGRAAPRLNALSDDELANDPSLHKAISDYYDHRRVQRNTVYEVDSTEFTGVEEITVIERRGDRALLELRYRRELSAMTQTGGTDRAEVLVELIPAVSNEVYAEDSFGKSLVTV